MLRMPPAHRWVHLLLAAALLSSAAWLPARSACAEERIGGVSVTGDPVLSAAVPSVRMPAGVLRTGDGRTLWERDADAERAMASTTKIMTALVVLDGADPSEPVTISPRAAAVGESGVDLAAGDVFTVQQLLEAMLVRSANDAAYALAEHVSGDEDAFVARMNEKAAALGLSKTAFTNAHGLDEPGHHTSASDLATLTTVAMADPRFSSIVGMPAVTVTTGGRTTTYPNSNELVGTYEGATGVKTGWTNDAGYCLVASAERAGVALVAVVLGTTSEDDRVAQARTLLDWGFAHYAQTRVASAETTTGLVPVTDYLDRTVTAVVSEDATVPVFDLDGEIVTSVDVVPEVDAPVVAGQRLGTMSVVQGERLLAQVPVVAATSVPVPDPWEAAGIWFTRVWRTVFGGDLQAEPVPAM